MTVIGEGGFDGVLVRTIGGVLGGFAVMFLLVMLTTWLALLTTGVGAEQGPTAVYLALNLAGSLVAAIAGGLVTRRVGRSPLGVWVLAAALLVMGLVSFRQPASVQPGWYPAVIAVLGVGGVLVGGLTPYPRRADAEDGQTSRLRRPA